MNRRETQARAAGVLLEKGVRVRCAAAPLLLRLFGLKKVDIILRQPTLADLIRTSEIIVKMGLDPADLDGMTLGDSFRLVAGHGREALRVLAIVCGPKWIPESLYARWLGRHLNGPEFAEAWTVFVVMSGVSDFIGTIRLMQGTNNLSPTDTESHKAE